MKLFSTHTRPAVDGPEHRVVPDQGFWGTVWAAVFGPLWLFFHGAWLAGLAGLLAELLLAGFRDTLGEAGVALRLAIQLGIALFGADLRRLELRIGGFSEHAPVAAHDADHALFRARELPASGVAAPAAPDAPGTVHFGARP